jgi:hypothetical protein
LKIFADKLIYFLENLNINNIINLKKKKKYYLLKRKIILNYWNKKYLKGNKGIKEKNGKKFFLNQIYF